MNVSNNITTNELVLAKLVFQYFKTFLEVSVSCSLKSVFIFAMAYVSASLTGLVVST